MPPKKNSKKPKKHGVIARQSAKKVGKATHAKTATNLPQNRGRKQPANRGVKHQTEKLTYRQKRSHVKHAKQLKMNRRKMMVESLAYELAEVKCKNRKNMNPVFATRIVNLAKSRSIDLGSIHTIRRCMAHLKPLYSKKAPFQVENVMTPEEYEANLNAVNSQPWNRSR